jgi:hypothetical protein
MVQRLKMVLRGNLTFGEADAKQNGGTHWGSFAPLKLIVIRHVNGKCRTFPVKNERK